MGQLSSLSSGEILRQLSSLSSAKSFGQLSSAQLSFFFQNLQLWSVLTKKSVLINGLCCSVAPLCGNQNLLFHIFLETASQEDQVVGSNKSGNSD
jgi:hypothetical protein